MTERMTADERVWADLSRDMSHARLTEAVGASPEEVEAIMRGDAPDSGGTALPEPRNTCG